MAAGVTTPLYFTSFNTASGAVTGAPHDFRASQGNFCAQYLGSGTNAGFGNSAQLNVQHSIDLTAWFNLSSIIVSGTGTTGQTWFSAGAYSFVRGQLSPVWSGATGTGIVSVSFFANNQGG